MRTQPDFLIRQLEIHNSRLNMEPEYYSEAIEHEL